VGTSRLLRRVEGNDAIRFWLWIALAYVAIVLLLLIVGTYVGGVPGPSDVGFSD
jgi:hypothetical protein